MVYCDKCKYFASGYTGSGGSDFYYEGCRKIIGYKEISASWKGKAYKVPITGELYEKNGSNDCSDFKHTKNIFRIIFNWL